MDDAASFNQQTPIIKSWVAARYTVIETSGIFKRRCKFAECNKEYSRGTSHMILKRHWAKQHSEQFTTQTTPKGRNRTVSTTCHQNNSLSQNINDHTKSKKKRVKQNGNSIPLKSANNNGNNKSSGDKSLPDSKLVAKRLKEAPAIHLTFEIHGGSKKGGKVFGIVTAHSYSDGIIRSVLLEYKHLPFPYDSAAIFEFLRSCIVKFNIREKIVSIASGCIDYITSSIIELDKKMKLSKNFNFTTCNVRCFPQFIHLNITEVLKTQESLIEYVRRIVGIINNSEFISIQQVQQENVGVNNIISSNGAKQDMPNSGQIGLKLLLDNKSNWNTTIEMIENFLQHRDIIQASLHYLQTSAPQQFLPMELQNYNFDWDKLFNLFELLRPFQDIVKRFINDNYVPLSIMTPLISRLMSLLTRQWCFQDLEIAAQNIKMQLEIYQQNYLNDMTTISSILDPRIKLAFIHEQQKAEIPALLRSKFVSPVVMPAREYTFPISSIFHNIFISDIDEVDHYLGNPRLAGSTDIFCFWEAHKNVYPNLYALARVLLCTQATSVPSDRMFSAAENLDRERKVNSTTSESKELLKSWTKYLEKKP